ncbi:GDSL-type esterase/lipase family protein [Planctomicrobium sp. SH661]|uniref:SGNH/GDSL hydrolase family protein n=1 Tax=Planctomicrobium sp. SH661 TaxID=3448124 RepID=UPI003F5B76E3
MRRFLTLSFSLLWLHALPLWAAEPEPFPGTPSDWNGFQKFEFKVAGQLVTVVCPKTPAPGRPWVWHGEFFGHKPAPDIALLEKGFHVAYMLVPDKLGSPGAVNYWNQCYAELTGKYGLAAKPALVGLSRGGLYCYNWAAANPDKVACIYADAPVCDFKSWPGGKGTGPGDARNWQLVLENYGFKDEAEAMAYKLNPVDNLAPLAAAKVPLLHVYGDADEIVPWEENTGLVAERYRALGGDITLIVKPGVKHHPHGLEDSTPIVEFIEKHASVAPAPPKFAPVKAELIRPRQGLGNFFTKLLKGGPIKIAYLGGSITAADGWRVKTRNRLESDFTNARVSEIHAAIGGTGSDLGVFRVEHDVLRFKPDLLFIEFAVNDAGAPPEQIWRCMEGIVRQTWTSNPTCDICFVYTFRTGFENDLLQGNCPPSASAMEMLADHYGIPSINFAKEIVELQQAGKLVYESAEATPEGVIRFSTDGVHPLDAGHQIYADIVLKAFQQMESKDPPVDHSVLLKTPFVQDHLQAAKMAPIDPAMLSEEWYELAPDSSLSKSFSNRLGTIWEAAQPGSSLSFRFRGSEAKLYDILAPDGGQVTITVDGKTQDKPIPRFDSYCTYPRIATLTVAQDLNPDETHTVTVTVHPEQPDRSSVAFRLKDPEKELKEPKYQGTNVRVGKILVVGEVLPN